MPSTKPPPGRGFGEGSPCPGGESGFCSVPGGSRSMSAAGREPRCGTALCRALIWGQHGCLNPRGSRRGAGADLKPPAGPCPPLSPPQLSTRPRAPLAPQPPPLSLAAPVRASLERLGSNSCSVGGGWHRSAPLPRHPLEPPSRPAAPGGGAPEGWGGGARGDVGYREWGTPGSVGGCRGCRGALLPSFLSSCSVQPLAGTLCSLLGVWLQRGGAPEPFLPPPQRPWGRFWQGGQQRAEPSSFFFQPEPHRATNEPILFIF